MQIQIPVKYLKLTIIVYLALPFFIFFLTWLKLIYGVPLSLVLFYCCFSYIKQLDTADSIKIPVWQGLLSFLVIAIWVGVSGNGAMGVQWNDLIKPVAISKDIITAGQPILYHAGNESFFLCQYLGIYTTVPTLLGFLPWEGVMFATYLYVLLGACLGMVWFLHHVDSFSPIWALFFVFFCGIDFAGYAYSVGLKNAVKSIFIAFDTIQPFWGNTMIDPAMKFMYQSQSHALFWGPQHALASWIGMGMFFYDFKTKKNITGSPFYLALLVFWSPFIVIGIFPFLAYTAFREKFWQYFSLQNLLMIPIVMVVVWYMSSLPLQEIKSGLIFYKSQTLSGYWLQIKAFAIFWIADIGVWLVPVCWLLWKSREDRFLGIFTLILLTLVPLYTFGIYNDWSQRVSMPGIFLMAILAVKVIRVCSTKMRIYFAIIFLLGAWDPFYFVSHSLKYTGGKPFAFMPLPFEKTPTYYEACFTSGYPIYQNVAPTSASFYQIMCRKDN